MKPFSLFFGASGQLGTMDVTDDHQYKIVVTTVNHLRNHLLKEPILREPFIHILNTVYNDDTPFPQDLEFCTPVYDRVSNKSKIRNMRDGPPTDDDIINFLTNHFPDLYMAPGDFGPQGVDWGETLSGREEADEEKIEINCRLVQLWLQAVSMIYV
jgi:hypothetical protein